MNHGLAKLLAALGIILGIYFLFNNFSILGTKGSGNIEEKLYSFSDFDQIEADGVMDIVLAPTTATHEEVRVTADDNLQKYIVLKQEGKSLHIKMKKNNVRSKHGIKIYVFYKKLEEVDADIVGKITASDKIISDRFKVKKDGVGRMILPVECNTLTIENDGVGSIELHGSAQNANLKNEGVGSINAYYLEVGNLAAVNDGTGSMQLYATQTLSMVNDGVGSISYHGDAQVTSQVNDGVGKIKKVEAEEIQD